VLTRGIAAWRALLEERKCAVAQRTGEHLVGVTPESPQDTRRETLSRIGGWLGTLPPRLALEQEDALRIAAGRCGYSSHAVERAFRARYWQEPRQIRSAGEERELSPVVPEHEPMDVSPGL